MIDYQNIDRSVDIIHLQSLLTGARQRLSTLVLASRFTLSEAEWVDCVSVRSPSFAVLRPGLLLNARLQRSSTGGAARVADDQSLGRRKDQNSRRAPHRNDALSCPSRAIDEQLRWHPGGNWGARTAVEGGGRVGGERRIVYGWR